MPKEQNARRGILTVEKKKYVTDWKRIDENIIKLDIYQL